MPFRAKPIEERFWSFVKRGEPDECWLWTGALQQPRGYGKLRVGRRGQSNVYAHRLAWAIMVGPIPPGYDVHHVCGNKRCCNPKHLQLIAREDHIRERGGSPEVVMPGGRLEVRNGQVLQAV